MRDVLTELHERWARGETTALATVVRTFRSAPREPGASMLRLADDTVLGSVSGGCVEGDVYERGGQVLSAGTPMLQRYGISDDDAYAVGLTCGGVIDVFVEPVSKGTFADFDSLAADIEAERPVALATIITHPDPARLGRRLVVRPDEVSGSLGSDFADHAITDDARGLLEAGATSVLTYGPEGERRGEGMEVFVNSFAPRPRMLVFGAIDFAAAMARQGTMLGYRVTLCDARALFATRARFPDVDEIVVDWPHRYLRAEIDAGRVDKRTVVCILTHDPKFDVPVLQAALDLPQRCYIGAMGSRTTHKDRMDRLREAGATEDQLARIHSPIGLDLGGRTPEETAVSIAAEIIANRWKGSGESLSRTDGRIHHSD
ncbi:XdhC family protein [Pseudactinotalea sp. Z1739]|uniref:XdhC family protein n=2 Tax=Actinomycetes TaxID=1760 RepID=UPI003C7D5F88